MKFSKELNKDTIEYDEIVDFVCDKTEDQELTVQELIDLTDAVFYYHQKLRNELHNNNIDILDLAFEVINDLKNGYVKKYHETEKKLKNKNNYDNKN